MREESGRTEQENEAEMEQFKDDRGRSGCKRREVGRGEEAKTRKKDIMYGLKWRSVYGASEEYEGQAEKDDIGREKGGNSMKERDRRGETQGKEVYVMEEGSDSEREAEEKQIKGEEESQWDYEEE